MVMRSPSSAVLLLAVDMFEVSSNEVLLVGNEIGSGIQDTSERETRRKTNTHGM
jgi:adenosyl cobinamide kinase/adenosyl cobinamide phosphate guanylyltransferase